MKEANLASRIQRLLDQNTDPSAAWAAYCKDALAILKFVNTDAPLPALGSITHRGNTAIPSSLMSAPLPTGRDQRGGKFRLNLGAAVGGVVQRVTEDTEAQPRLETMPRNRAESLARTFVSLVTPRNKKQDKS